MSNVTSNQKFSSWQDVVFADDKMKHFNKNIDAVVAIIYCAQNATQNMVLDYLKDHSRIGLLSVEKLKCIVYLFHQN